MLVLGTFLLVAAISALVRKEWVEAAIPLVLIPAIWPPFIIEKWARVRIPGTIQAQYALLLLAGPYIGGQLRVYATWPPWDTVVHFYSGFLISFAAVFALGVTIRRYRLSLPPWLEAVLIISVKGLIAVLWEIAEFIYDQLLDIPLAQIDNFDTMTDMIAGLIPGFLIAAALILHRRKRWFRYLGSLLNVPPGPTDERLTVPS